MSRPSFVIGIAAVALVAATAATPASANIPSKLTHLTFTAPVQIPGATLAAGTYRFRLADPDSGRKVVQVLSDDGSYVYGMFHTMPDYRSVVTEESTVTFMEAPAGVAPPVKSLFYAGEHDGYMFVYGRGQPNLTPPLVVQPEITYTPIVAAAPILESTDRTWETSEPAVTADTAVITSEPVAAEPIATEPATLPATGSVLPVTALGGFASLALGLGVGLLRRRGA